MSPSGVIAKVLDFGFELSELDLQSFYNVHFRTDTLGKGMNSLKLLGTG